MGLPENQPQQPPAGVDRQRFNRAIQDARRAYPHILPRRPGRLRSLALKLFYSGIRLEETQARVLRELPTDGIVVFTTRFRSAFSFLFHPVPLISWIHSILVPFPRSALTQRLIDEGYLCAAFDERIYEVDDLPRWPTVQAFDMSSWKYVVLRPFQTVNIAKVGDAERRTIITEFALVCKTPTANAKITAAT